METIGIQNLDYFANWFCSSAISKRPMNLSCHVDFHKRSGCFGFHALLLWHINARLTTLWGWCRSDGVIIIIIVIAFFHAVVCFWTIVDVAFLVHIRSENSFEFWKFVFVDFQFVYQPARWKRLSSPIVVNVIIVVINVCKWEARHTKAFVQIRVFLGQWHLNKLDTGRKLLWQSMIVAFDRLAGFAPSCDCETKKIMWEAWNITDAQLECVSIQNLCSEYYKSYCTYKHRNGQPLGKSLSSPPLLPCIVVCLRFAGLGLLVLRRALLLYVAPSSTF